MPSRHSSDPLLTLAPWRRAPFLVLRAPGVVAAIVASAFLLTLAVASRPLFVASAGAAAIERDLRDGCRYDVGLRVATGRIPRSATADGADVAAIPRRTTVLNQEAGADGLQPPIITVAGGTFEVASPKNAPKREIVQLLSRTGAFDHVSLRTRPPSDDGEGLWLPDSTAALLGVTAGDEITVLAGDRPISDRVAGVFADLTYVERSPFWCSQERIFEPLADTPLPPVALASQEHLLDLLRRAGRPSPAITWELPPTDGLSVPAADDLSTRLNRAASDLRAPTPFSERFGTMDGSLAHVGLPDSMLHAHMVTRQVRTTADTVGAAGTAIAGVAVAAAGFFWVERRRNELTLLLSKGVAPVALAAKAALEAAIPVLLGGTAGFVAAAVSVRALGPSDAFDNVATADAARLSVLAAIAGVLLVGAVAGVRIRRIEHRMAAVTHPARFAVPALAGLTVAAIVAGINIERSADKTQLGSQSLGLVLVVFPLLVFIGGGLVLAVGGHLLLPRTRRIGRGWPIAPYLALRRVVAAGPVALALAASAVVSAGILAYASTVATSARATVTAEAGLAVGGDLAAYLTTEDVPPLPPALDRRSTAVLVTATTTAGDDRVDLLGVDPATFGRGALYDKSFAGRSLDSLLGRLDARSDRDGSALPVIAADAAGLPDRFVIDTPSGPVQVEVRARAHAFPGLSGEKPLLVAKEDDLRARGINGSRQLWVTGPTSSVKAQLDRAHVPYSTTVVSRLNETGFTLLPLATSLGYFKALGVLGGFVTLSGAILYLAARERSRRLAGVMTRGMGLRRAAARTALALELIAVLVTGLVVGGSLAAVAAKTSFTHLDPSPNAAPQPIFRFDWATLVIALAVAIVAAVALAFVSERSSARRPAAEVMRDA